MIVACPKCKTKLKVADERIGPEGLRVKCPSCATVLAVKRPAPPKPAPPPAVPKPVPEPVSEAVAPPIPKPAAPAPPAAVAEEAEGTIPGVKKILVAHSDKSIVDTASDILKAGGYEVTTASSGDEVEAIVSFTKPQMMLLDVALPGKVLGFDVCRKVKENPATKDIKIILISEIHHEGRYRRTPESLHGADAYLDEHEMADHLIAKLVAIAEGREYKTPSPGFAGPGPEFIPPRGQAQEEAVAPPLPKAPEAAQPRPPEAVEPRRPARREAFLFDERPSKPAPVVPPPPKPEAVVPPPPKPEAVVPPPPKPEAVVPPPPKPVVPTPPPAPKPEPPKPALAKPAPAALSADEMTVKAKRLARTILADIYLYGSEKVENAVKAGKFRETFADEIKEGKKIYDSRFAAGLPDSDSFFDEEMENFINLRKKALGL